MLLKCQDIQCELASVLDGQETSRSNGFYCTSYQRASGMVVEAGNLIDAVCTIYRTAMCLTQGHSTNWRKLLRKAEIILHTAPEIASVAPSTDLLPPEASYTTASESSVASSTSSMGSNTPSRPSDLVALAGEQLVQNAQVFKELIKPEVSVGWSDMESTPSNGGGKRILSLSPETTQLTHIRRRINIADSVDDDSS
ncbi:uncharacterized protein [Amphiura filiformis]|uniref:uncharacterized protein n=1 Tax=Amphiura filiformis TaxID=82378 RepID=UPI003B219701